MTQEVVKEERLAIKVTAVRYYTPDPNDYGEITYDGRFRPYATTVNEMAAYDRLMVDDGDLPITEFLVPREGEEAAEYEFVVVLFTTYADGRVTEEEIYKVPDGRTYAHDPDCNTIHEGPAACPPPREHFTPEAVKEAAELAKQIHENWENPAAQRLKGFLEQQILSEAKASVALDGDTVTIEGPVVVGKPMTPEDWTVHYREDEGEN